MKLINLVLVTLLTATLVLGAEATKPRRILIYSAKIGQGHESSAKAIKKGILERDPTAIVEIHDVRSFSGTPVLSWFNAKAYGWMVKYKPQWWDAMYKKQMEDAQKANSVTDFSKPYDEKLILADIQQFDPDMIVNTFNIGVDSLISLREQKLLDPKIKIAWIHTDYVNERYHQLLSRDIEMTFLAHEAMQAVWKDAGIPEEKVMTTGMAIDPVFYKELSAADRETFMKESGLDPKKKTIVLMSGKEGVGNFKKVINSIAENFSEDVQIVAICGVNKWHKWSLPRMKLPPNVKLFTEGFIPLEKVFKYVKSSDVYITKSGGLSPTEAFVVGTPLVLLDINGGQERYNSVFFDQQGLARIAATESDAGAATKALLNDKAAQQSMLAAQAKFREQIKLDLITDYIMAGAKPLSAYEAERATQMAKASYVVPATGNACPAFYGH